MKLLAVQYQMRKKVFRRNDCGTRKFQGQYLQILKVNGYMI